MTDWVCYILLFLSNETYVSCLTTYNARLGAFVSFHMCKYVWHTWNEEAPSKEADRHVWVNCHSPHTLNEECPLQRHSWMISPSFARCVFFFGGVWVCWVWVGGLLSLAEQGWAKKEPPPKPADFSCPRSFLSLTQSSIHPGRTWEPPPPPGNNWLWLLEPWALPLCPSNGLDIAGRQTNQVGLQWVIGLSAHQVSLVATKHIISTTKLRLSPTDLGGGATQIILSHQIAWTLRLLADRDWSGKPKRPFWHFAQIGSKPKGSLWLESWQPKPGCTSHALSGLAKAV